MSRAPFLDISPEALADQCTEGKTFFKLERRRQQVSTLRCLSSVACLPRDQGAAAATGFATWAAARMARRKLPPHSAAISAWP